MNELTKFLFYGDSRSMGIQHGEALRHRIRDLADIRIDLIRSGNPRATVPIIRNACTEVLAEIERQTPEVFDELCGISFSSQIEAWKLVIAGGYSDIAHMVGMATKSADGFYECTIIPVRDKSGRILIAGTWDSHPTAQESLVLLERKPIDGPSTLALSTAGWPMQQGVTSEGLGFAIANLNPKSIYQGITYVAALPRIVSQACLVKATQEVKCLKLCSGRFFALCDSKNYVGIETDGKQFWTDSRLTPHTNHYLFDGAIDFEGRPAIRKDSESRRLSAVRELSNIYDSSIEALLQVLSYDDGTEASISKLGLSGGDRTGAGFVLDPTELSISFTIGPPSQSISHTTSRLERD